MKKILRPKIALVLLTILFTKCSLANPSVTINDRINQFLEDLNSNDRSNIYLNFHPSTTNLNQIKDPTFFDTTPLSLMHREFTFSSSMDPISIGNDQKQINGMFYSNTGVNPFSCIFIMEMDGEDWYIREFHIAGIDIVLNKMNDYGHCTIQKNI